MEAPTKIIRCIWRALDKRSVASRYSLHYSSANGVISFAYNFTMNPNDHSVHLPYYVDATKNRHHFYENHWKRVALDLLLKYAGSVEGLTMLDYGCGRGEAMDYAAKLGMKPLGVDLDPRCVALASRYGTTRLLDLSSPDAHLQPKSFDVVACFHVLEHVPNPKETLSMLGKTAKRYVIVAVPNLQKIPNIRRPRAHPAKTNEGHLQSWDHSHFLNLAETHCSLRLVSWANDATIVPVASELIRRLFGQKAVIALETGLFRNLFPYWGLSIIALLEPSSSQA